MRTSHQQIRKRIMEERSKITDEEFFSSKAYQAYITDICEAATKRYRRPLKVTIVADHDDETLAHTDFKGIYINACNEITWSMPGRMLRSLSIEGLAAHENGHNLFTDNRVWRMFQKALESGRFYPKMPHGLDGIQKLHAQEILDALQDDTDDIPKMVICSTAHALSNILEDGYVDARYSFEFPGNPARGITLNNLRISEKAPDIQTMIDRKFCDHNIVMNLLIQYINAGEVNNLSGYSGELLDKLADLIPVVDGCIHDEDTRARCEAANWILIELWPFMQRSFDMLRDMQKNAQQSSCSATGQPSGTAPAGTGQGNPGQQNAQAGAKTVQEELDSQLPKLPQNFTLSTSAVPSTGNFIPDGGQAQTLRTQVERVLAEETDRIASHISSLTEGEGKGGVTMNSQFSGSGYQHAAEDINRVLEEMAQGRVHEAMEEELTEELQQEADGISYGNAHRNISVKVNRMAHVDQELIDAYQSVAPELLMLSKRLQRSVKGVLQDRRQGGKQTGLLSGKRLNQHAFHRNDGRIFCNSRLPTEPINLSVALLIDESGSMCGNDRITRARATAIVVQDFCEKLGIPIMIMGHTAWNSHVDLFSYAEFQSVDKNDRYRLMDMSPRDCNRDGAALRFVAEKLYKHVSEVKLLIIICDGQPNDDGYSGTGAEADLRGIKLEYSRKGVKIFAAAIGDDRDRIERIYGSGFLDITDLNQLPIMLTNLISRNLPL